MKLTRIILLLSIALLLTVTLAACRRSDGGVRSSGPTLEPTLAAGIDQTIDDLDQMLRDLDQDLQVLETPLGP